MPRLQLAFRLATPDDAEALAALINGAYRVDSTTEVYVDGNGDRSGLCITSAAAMRAKIEQQTRPEADSEVAVLVATAAGGDPTELLGHASLTRRGQWGQESGGEKVAWLGMLAVDGSRQGAGLGSQVLAHAGKYAGDCWGARRLEFDVINTRAGLRAWYEKRGCLPKKTKEEDGGHVTSPFPYAAHGDGWHDALKPDLLFVVYSKAL